MGMQSSRRLIREPAGVAACITPWNAPMQVNLAKVAFALAAGCTVVLKPAPDTPWSATVLGRLAVEETDLPPGVFNVVPTSDNAVAQILAEDPRVDLISFTGSTAVGRHLMAVAAQTVKRVFLELGGKSAWIICDDADLDTNAAMLAFQSLAQAGTGLLDQHPGHWCNARSTTRCSTRSSRPFERLPYGDPQDAANLHGSADQRQQQKRVLDYIEIGKAEGARLVMGGGRPAHLPRGYYVEPTIFADVDPDSRIAQEEIFGPVLSVIPFDTDDEAIRIANSTIFGLGRHRRERLGRAGTGHRGKDPFRRRQCERRHVLQLRGAVRRLQAERDRPRNGHARTRGIHRGQGHQRGRPLARAQHVLVVLTQIGHRARQRARTIEKQRRPR